MPPSTFFNKRQHKRGDRDFFQFVREFFTMFFQNFAKFSWKKFRKIKVFACFWKFSDAFGYVPIHSDTIGRVGMLVASVLNAGEAGGEICSPTPPVGRNVRSQAVHNSWLRQQTCNVFPVGRIGGRNCPVWSGLSSWIVLALIVVRIGPKL